MWTQVDLVWDRLHVSVQGHPAGEVLLVLSSRKEV